jgi:hypothetical protein
MSVRQDYAANFIAVLQQIGDVRNYDVHPEQLGFWEHQAGVDDDNVVTVAHGHAIHSKFAKTA